MMNIDQNILLYFFSTIAQVFGALLGLLGLAYTRVADDIDKTIDSQLNYLFSLLKDSFDKIEKESGNNIDIKVDSVSEIHKVLEKYKDDLGHDTYETCKSTLKTLNQQVTKQQFESKTFRKLCIFLVTLIITGIGGCLLSNILLEVPITMFFVIALIVCLMSLCTVLTGKQFISIAKSSRVKSFYSNR